MKKNITISPLRMQGQNQRGMFDCWMLFISVRNSQGDTLIPGNEGKEENLRASGDNPVCLRLPWSWRFREGVGAKRETKRVSGSGEWLALTVYGFINSSAFLPV